MTTGLALVEDIEAGLRPLERSRNVAWWDANLDASQANERRRLEAEVAYTGFLADPELYAALGRASLEGEGPVARRVELLRNAMLPHQVPSSLRTRLLELEAAVEGRFTRHRGVVGGTEVDDNAIKRTLRQSDDESERREAWEASKTVGAAVAHDVRELARLRNEAARTLGYRDWFALSLAKDELDEDRLLATLAEADLVTAEPYARWKSALDEQLAERFGRAVDDLRPWHYADPFFQEPPAEGGVDLDPLFSGRDVVELARATYEALGLEVDAILGRSDLYPRPGKCQHAFCIDVDRAGDVRVLANVADNHDWATTMLHELGHGVYDLGFDRELPWLLRETHLVTTEACALLFGALATDAEWLEEVAGLSAGEADELGARIRAARAAELLVFTRWVLVMTSFERALYADPESDLDATWWKLVARHQLVTPPEGRSAPDWAAKIHVAVAPVYYHTYLYGSIVALQLHDALHERVGGLVGRPEAGALLASELFAPGASVRWDELVRQASGRPLSVESLARAVAA